MIIKGTGSSVPKTIVSNDTIIDKVLTLSQNSFDGNILELKNILDTHLRFLGSNHRYVRGAGEKALDHVVRAGKDALIQAELTTDQIDLVIYTGVGRGFIEPAMAYVVADALNMKTPHCFDVLDACMSWIRALYIARSFLQNGLYKNIMVVSCEMNLKVVSDQNYTFSSMEDLRFRLPTLTIGEAATATILSKSTKERDEAWSFQFTSMPEGQNLCYIPLPWSDDYAFRPLRKSNINHSFYSYYEDMAKLGHDRAIKLADQYFNKNQNILKRVKKIFCHADQSLSYYLWAKNWGVEEKLDLIFPEYGNCASSSIPLAINLAQNRKELNRMDEVLCLVVSAGVSCACVHFKY